MQTTSAQWLGCFCKKMCRSNTCKKSHFVRKINWSKTLSQYRPTLFSATAIFCCH